MKNYFDGRLFDTVISENIKYLVDRHRDVPVVDCPYNATVSHKCFIVCEEKDKGALQLTERIARLYTLHFYFNKFRVNRLSN